MQTWHIILDVLTTAIAAAGVGWLGWRSLGKSKDPAQLVVRWIVTAGLIYFTVRALPHFPPPMWPVVVLIPAMIIGVMWAPSVGTMLFSSLTDAIDGGDIEPDPQAYYSIAEARRRSGHPAEALTAIRGQLEKFPGDFRGTMLMATILAEDMNDFPGAQMTLERWIESPQSTPHGKAAALTLVADWQLQYAQDPEAARAALERIVNELPGTPAAHQATQRIAHLPSAADLVEACSRGAVDVKEAIRDLGLRQDFKPETPEPADPASRAAEYVKQLELHPSDTATREKLAVLYADDFQRLDLATDQLEQLIALPLEKPRQIVRWLHLLADLQIRVGRDVPAAEATLRRVFEIYDTPALTEPTRERLGLLAGELKAGEKTTLKTLGSYQKNVGLKKL